MIDFKIYQNGSKDGHYYIAEDTHAQNLSYSELYHYGVKGMKWGVRRTPEQLGHARLRKSKTYNLDKWGSDINHNICYITGISGSGKSTVAKSMADKSTDVIHLDAYYEKNSIEKTNKAFDEYLSERGIKPPKQYDISKWSQVQVLEKFENALDSFGKSQFLKNRKVLAEGVQIYNGTLFDEQQYYKGKPVIFVNTGVLESIYKAVKRTSDYEEVSFLEALGSFENAKTWVNNSFKSKEYLKDFEKRITHSYLTHYGVKGMHWGVRKDLAKARLYTFP